MANSTITLTISLVMISLFTVAIISFSIGFANENGAAMSIEDEMSPTSIRIEDDLSTFKSETEKTFSSISDSKTEPGSDVLQSPGSFTITWKNVFDVFGNIMDSIKYNIFGNDPKFRIFFTAFLSIIGFMAALYIIKTWRGNP